MGKTACDILFDYLRDLLYEPDRARVQLDVEALPEEYKKLGLGLVYLKQLHDEASSFAEALGDGRLHVPVPGRDNVFADPLKELHASLSHMAWQARQVALGDYSQLMASSGEFSEAFNTMVEQLKYRQQVMNDKTEIIQQKNAVLEQEKLLLMELTNSNPNWITVLKSASGEVLFSNHALVGTAKEKPVLYDHLIRQLARHALPPKSDSRKWQLCLALPSGDEKRTGTQYYAIHSHPAAWGEAMATVHIITDFTASRERENRIRELAYRDSLTGLYNRRHAMETFHRWRRRDRQFTIGFVDIDNLKYTNDTFGHDEGDRYILHTVERLKQTGGIDLLARIGGDEFMVFSHIAREKLEVSLEQSRTLLRAEESPYLQTFSYGCAQSDPSTQEEDAEIMRSADVRMYQYKYENKPKL